MKTQETLQSRMRTVDRISSNVRCVTCRDCKLLNQTQGVGEGTKSLDERIFIFGLAEGSIVKGRWLFKERPLIVINYRVNE